MRVSESEASLAELKRLVDTAGAEAFGVLKHEIKAISPATFVGKGTVEKIKEAALACCAGVVIFDDELSPAQNRNLSEEIGIKVLDRTAVILDIFAKHARTREGELQVELAQLDYRLSRLSGKGLALSQQAGYIGNRGPGETKLEVDKRKIRVRISFLKKALQNVRKHRELHRRKRESVPIPVVSLIGYTNAGKSTLMNALTSAGVLVEDKLFATLDPTVRKMKLKSSREILIADTVGFIRNLPHQLIESFRATLEEMKASDLLIHVIDASEPEAEHQIRVVEGVLADLEMAEKACLKVYNKCDARELFIRDMSEGVKVSALKREGLRELSEKLESLLLINFKHARLKLPNTAGNILSELYRIGKVNNVRYGQKEMAISAELPEKLLGRYRKFCV